MDREKGLETRKLQHAYDNGQEVAVELVMSTPEYVVREYQI
ncbi:hypothetical protein [Pontibacter brevis]